MNIFTDKVILITGASSGIGAALAREFAREGARVVLTARRKERLRQLQAELERDGCAALAVTCDVTRDGDLEQAVAAACEKFGRLDVVVANAGFGVAGRLDQLTLDDYRRQFETNIFGVLRTIYAGLPELRKTKGRLVLLGSVAGYISFPGASPYAMSKFAVRGLAEAITDELKPQGISVLLVSPGFIDSEFRKVDNSGMLRPDAPDPISRWLKMPAEKAARQIVHATAKRRREIIITGHGRCLVFIQQHLPVLITWIKRLGAHGRGEPKL